MLLSGDKAAHAYSNIRWQRDPGVEDMVKYFDQEKYILDPGAIPAREVAALRDEVRKCQANFEYAARNYFWIVDKVGNDQLFRLWESQELILDTIYRIKNRGKAQKLQIIKARQLGAMDPQTKVVTHDLRWIEIDSLNPGDEVLASDEYSFVRGAGRKFRTATVLDKWEVTKEAFKITLENGKTIIATGDHPFLCKKRGAVATEWRKVSEKRKARKTSSPIRPGDEIRFVVDPWTETVEFEDGWFAGLLDGEGSLRAKDNCGVELSVSQVDGPVLKRAAEYLTSRNYNFRVEVDTRKSGASSKLGNQPVYKFVLNRMADVFRALGTLRPERWVGRRPWEGKELPHHGDGKSWLRVVSVEPIGLRRMIDIRTTTSTFIAEGLVTHNCSTLIEGLIAWRSMYFPNTNAMVVSHVPRHASYLFGIMLHIYDQLPWWMKPMISSRKEELGLVFKNPDETMRRVDPGLNSMVTVQAANQVSGVGEGYRLNAVHASEYASWDQDGAREIIDGDMVHALAENPGTFAILESTAKGAGTFAEELWIANKELEDKADWMPLFLPWFFEKTRFVAPEAGWHPGDRETEMRDRVADEWVRCTHCGEFRERHFKEADLVGTECVDCRKGTRESYTLTDEQLCWMQDRVINATRRGPESLKELRQELCTTSEESFQISGIQVFPADTQEYVNLSVRRPVYIGNLDNKGRLHAAVKTGTDTWHCLEDWCKLDHRFDAEQPLRVWELPEENAEYVIGVDVAEGLGGKADYSVAWVNKVGRNLAQDKHVATWRSNTIDPAHFAAPVVFLGKMYNEAMLSIEYNNYQTTGDLCRIFYGYPNLFRWKHYDTVRGMDSNKWHWITQQNSKPGLWQNAVRRLREKSWVVKDELFAHEMKRFQKEEYDSKKASADKHFHDDVVMAAMIALFTSHDLDWDENFMEDTAVRTGPGVQQSMEWHMDCLSCKHEWPAGNPEMFPNCPKCGSIRLHGKRNINEEAKQLKEFDEMGRDDDPFNVLPEYQAHY